LDLIVTVFFNVCSPPVFTHHLSDLLPFFVRAHGVRPCNLISSNAADWGPGETIVFDRFNK
jgi:hypothetical protein